MPPEAKDFTPEDIAEAERIYQEKLNKDPAAILQDRTGMLKRVYKTSAFREVKAAKARITEQDLTPQEAPKPAEKPKKAENSFSC